MWPCRRWRAIAARWHDRGWIERQLATEQQQMWLQGFAQHLRRCDRSRRRQAAVRPASAHLLPHPAGDGGQQGRAVQHRPDQTRREGGLNGPHCSSRRVHVPRHGQSERDQRRRQGQVGTLAAVVGDHPGELTLHRLALGQGWAVPSAPACPAGRDHAIEGANELLATLGARACELTQDGTVGRPQVFRLLAGPQQVVGLMPPRGAARSAVALEVDRPDIDDQATGVRAAVQHVEQPLTDGGRVVLAFFLLRGIQASQPGIDLEGQGGFGRRR